MTEITASAFGRTKEGEIVNLYTIRNQNQMSVTISDFGGTITSIKVADKKGMITDVVLGYEHLEDYERLPGYFGAIIGRYANRIAGGRFCLNDRIYQLAKNDGENHLHGGNRGFSHRMWKAKAEEQSLHLSYRSAHMEEGYPGTLEVSVVYTLDDENRLMIAYEAVSDQDTVCSLTNHTYFNLGGHNSGNIRDQKMKIFAESYLPADAGSIPTGEIAAVEGTPFDFRSGKVIGGEIDSACRQIQLAGGFDHNYVLDNEGGLPVPAAVACCAQTGISLKCDTTQPGLQFYTGNHIAEQGVVGKDGAVYGPRHGFCLETQAFPDAVNQTHFPGAMLKAGEQYRQVTIYQFQTAENE